MKSRGADPVDLANLRSWIDVAVANYERAILNRSDLSRRERTKYRKALESARNATNGSPRGRAADIVRGLLATGAVRYRGRAGIDANAYVPEQAVLDFVVFALWPMILAPKLPDAWYQTLEEISSSFVARLVTHARLSRTTGQPLSPAELYRALSGGPFNAGVIKLLDDLNDPQRGGGSLTALAIATAIEPPILARSGKRTLAWILGAGVVLEGGRAALEGVIGNRVDAVVVDIWNWLTNDTAPTGSNNDGLIRSSSEDEILGNGATNHARSSGLLSILDDLF